MTGRLGIDDVAPVVSGGRYPGQGRGRRGGPGQARRSGARATTPSRPRWSCGITAPPIRGWRRRPRRRRPHVEAVPIDEVVGRRRRSAAALPMSPGAARRVPRPVRPRRRRAVDVPGGRLERPARRRGARPSPPSSRPARASRAGQRPADRRPAAASGPPTRRAAPGPLPADRRGGHALREPGDSVRPGAARRCPPTVADLLHEYPLRELVTRGEQYGVWVDRPLARFSAWYEMFPRSTGGWDGNGNARARHVRHREPRR